MKKYICIIMLLGLTLIGCDNKSESAQKSQQDKKEIIVGLPPSMHNIMMEKVVKPALEQKGYKVKLVNFSSLRD